MCDHVSLCLVTTMQHNFTATIKPTRYLSLGSVYPATTEGKKQAVECSLNLSITEVANDTLVDPQWALFLHLR